MTNNPTIDGVPRATIEAILKDGSCNPEVNDAYRAARTELRALLDAPAVERQEPEVVGWAHPRDLQSDGYSHSFTVRSEQPGTPYQDGNYPVALIQAEDHYAEVAALQSTISRLEARITQLESEKELMLRGAEVYKERIAELGSGRGEPIYQVQYRGEGGGGWSDAEKESYDAKVPHPKHWKTRIVYAAPPAPVAVVPDGWKLVPVEPTELMIRRGDQNYSWSVAKIYKAMIEDAPACLDATAALSKSP